jgi:hypothetical protein
MNFVPYFIVFHDGEKQGAEFQGRAEAVRVFDLELVASCFLILVLLVICAIALQKIPKTSKTRGISGPTILNWFEMNIYLNVLIG